MYIKYTYNAGSTMTNIIDDLVKIFGGESDSANYSTDCNLASTTIDNRLVANTPDWLIHDNIAGTNSQTIKHSRYDNASKFNYVKVDGSVLNNIYLKTYETWDNTTHTGVNETYSSQYSSSSCVIDTVNGGFISIYSTPRCLHINNNKGAATNGSTVIEKNRIDSFDTDTLSLPNIVHFRNNFGGVQLDSNAHATYIAGVPRWKNSDNFTDTVTSTASYGYITGPFGMQSSTSQALAYTFNGIVSYDTYSDSGSPIKSIMPIYYTMNISGNRAYLNNLSDVSDLFIVNMISPAIGDILVVGSNEYAVIGLQYGTHLSFACKVL